MADLYKEVYSQSNIFSAWRHVKRSAINSRNSDISGSASEFEYSHQRHLKRIADQLRDRRFKFSPVEGVLADAKARKRAGKDPRPIAISQIKDRVVQRAMLQVLQPREVIDPKDRNSGFSVRNDPRLGILNSVNTSDLGVGGLLKPYGGVQKASELVLKYISSGGRYYYRSDIKSFFTLIPVEAVLSIIQSEINDKEFCGLLKSAVELELSNKDEIGSYEKLFPQGGIGVAQGSSLSAFFANTLLFDFDKTISDKASGYIRYVDDIVIFSEDKNAIEDAINESIKYLKRWDMDLYEPSGSDDKAATGKCADGFTFVGCMFQPNRSAPSKKSRENLLNSINAELQNSRSNISDYCRGNAKLDPKLTVGNCLKRVGDRVYGWQKSFEFCNDTAFRDAMNKKIESSILDYYHFISRIPRHADNAALSRALGIPAIA